MDEKYTAERWPMIVIETLFIDIRRIYAQYYMMCYSIM